MLTAGEGICTPQARAKCVEDGPLSAWVELLTKGKLCTALPAGNFSTQKTTLAAAAHQTKAAKAPGPRLALRGVDKICNMIGL